MYAGNYNAIVGVIAVDLVTKSKRNKATDPVVSVENSKELSRAPLSTQPYDTADSSAAPAQVELVLSLYTINATNLALPYI